MSSVPRSYRGERLILAAGLSTVATECDLDFGSISECTPACVSMPRSSFRCDVDSGLVLELTSVAEYLDGRLILAAGLSKVASECDLVFGSTSARTPTCLSMPGSSLGSDADLGSVRELTPVVLELMPVVLEIAPVAELEAGMLLEVALLILAALAPAPELEDGERSALIVDSTGVAILFVAWIVDKKVRLESVVKDERERYSLLANTVCSRYACGLLWAVKVEVQKEGTICGVRCCNNCNCTAYAFIVTSLSESQCVAIVDIAKVTCDRVQTPK